MIFYFTGTGNSLYVAEQLDKQEDAKIVLIKEDLAARKNQIAAVTEADRAAHQQFLSRIRQMPKGGPAPLFIRVTDTCVGCGICREVCPTGSMQLREGKACPKRLPDLPGLRPCLPPEGHWACRAGKESRCPLLEQAHSLAGDHCSQSLGVTEGASALSACRSILRQAFLHPHFVQKESPSRLF